MILNKTHFRALALRRVGELRPAWPVTQVGDTLYVKAEAHLRKWLDNYIASCPSKGKTLR